MSEEPDPRVEACMRTLADHLGMRGPAREIDDADLIELSTCGARLRTLMAQIISTADRTNPAINALRAALAGDRDA